MLHPQGLRIGRIHHLVFAAEHVQSIAHGADVLEQHGAFPHHPMRHTIKPQRHGAGGRNRPGSDLPTTPQPQRQRSRTANQSNGQHIVAKVHARDQPHLGMHRPHEFLHGFLGIARLAPRMRKKFHGVNIGIGVGDASGHQRTGIGLFLRHARQARDEERQRTDVQHQPHAKRQQHERVELPHHRHQRNEIHRDEHHHVTQDVAHVAYGQRRLHDLGGHPARKFILIKTHALTQHEVVVHPAQTHGHVASKHLMLHQGVQASQQWNAGRCQCQKKQRSPLALPQLRRSHAGQPVNNAPQKTEQQGFQCRHRGSKDNERSKMPTHSVQGVAHKPPE